MGNTIHIKYFFLTLRKYIFNLLMFFISREGNKQDLTQQSLWKLQNITFSIETAFQKSF